MRIENLVFDLGGVVNAHDNDMLLERLQSKCRVGTTIDNLITEMCVEGYSTGRLNMTSFHKNLQEKFGYHGNWSEFMEDWCCHLSLYEDMLTLIEKISLTTRVILLSNTNLLHWEYLLRVSDFRLRKFEAFLSFDLGLMKPNSAIFIEVAKQAAIKPEHSLFIDDRQDNIDSALSCGYQTFLYTDMQSFKEKFKSLKL